MKKYLKLEIFKSQMGDCSNGGLSSKYGTCFVECDCGNWDEKNVPENAIVKLEKGAFGTIHLIPAKPIEKGCVGYMFGGCYCASSDSRFGELIEQQFGISHWHGAIALHDRTETQKEYEMYSC